MKRLRLSREGERLMKNPAGEHELWHELACPAAFPHMRERKSADGAVANLVRSGRKQPQRFRAGSSASTASLSPSPLCATLLPPGVQMDDFSFLAGLFGILFGLIVAEIATKFADAIDLHHRRRIGILTPLLACTVLMDATSFWIWFWSLRHSVDVRWHTIFIGLIVAVIYFLAAALVFPRGEGDWASLNDHYWARKRYVIGGILLVDASFFAWEFSRVTPMWNDWWFYFYNLPYFGPMIALLFTRTRRVDIALLVILLASLLSSGSDLFPGSQWGNRVGINILAHASTSGATVSR
jgi:hypothetical protein